MPTTADTTTLLPRLATDPALAPDSRLWIYLAERPLTAAETELAQRALDDFTRSWTAHNQALLAKAEVFQQQFILLAVDESRAGASGCSIDKSVHFLERLGQELGVDLLEKMRFAWADGQQWQVTGRTGFAARLASGDISAATLVANTLIQNKQELLHKWLLPYGASWHRRLF